MDRRSFGGRSVVHFLDGLGRHAEDVVFVYKGTFMYHCNDLCDLKGLLRSNSYQSYVVFLTRRYQISIDKSNESGKMIG